MHVHWIQSWLGAASLSLLGAQQVWAQPTSNLAGLAVLASAPVERHATVLREWARLDTKARARLDLDAVRKELEGSFGVRGTKRAGVDVALLVLHAACLADIETAGTCAIAALVRDALDQRLGARSGPGFEDYLVGTILAPGGAYGPAERAAACSVLGLHVRADHVATLVASATDADGSVRREARRALVGFPDARASRTLLAACEGALGREGTRARSELAEHLSLIVPIQGSEVAWPADLADRLPRAALGALVELDWRDATRGIQLARHCPFEASAPHYIEALHTWLRRERAASDVAELTGARRIMYEIADLLEQGSGLHLGIEPVRWTQWWRSHLEGTRLPADSMRSAVAGFFGLEVRSGAVAFVIDASGSMDYPLPSRTTLESKDTRFDEAIAQIDRVLGTMRAPSAFQVVLFNSDGERWSDGARRIDPSSRTSVRNWLQRKPPRGGTQLARGLDALLPRDREGRVRPELLDVDTVVVLCDGETTEGAAWARDWLATYNREAQLVFHCVQIGGSSASALEALASGSGGRFLRYDS